MSKHPEQVYMRQVSQLSPIDENLLPKEMLYFQLLRTRKNRARLTSRIKDVKMQTMKKAKHEGYS